VDWSVTSQQEPQDSTDAPQQKIAGRNQESAPEEVRLAGLAAGAVEEPEAPSISGTMRDANGTPLAAASVSGVVKDEQGLAVSGAEILLAGLAETDESIGRLRTPYIQLSRLFRTMSDGRGRYTIEGISFEGRAIVLANKKGYVPRRSQYVSLKMGQTSPDVDITLLAGTYLRGEVLAPDGTLVTDAIVDVLYAWNPKDHSISTRFAETDAAGRFTLHFDWEAEWCTLRVNSETFGQSFFIRVPVTDAEIIQFKMHRPATLRGTVSWEDGAPAEGVTVFLDGRVPEPDTGVLRSGWPPKACFRATVDGEGHYEIANIYPGLKYLGTIGIPDAKYPYNSFRATPLSSRNKVFRFNAGEVVVWDYCTASTITIKGYVRTEHTGQPVAGAYIAVRKDGQPIHPNIEFSDKNGFYEIRLGTGAGAYQVFPLTPLWPQLDMYEGLELDRRFGKEFRLEGGEDIKADLNLFEPIVLPIRVVDFQGDPITSADTELHLITVTGRRYGIGNKSDKDGRKTFLIHMPLSEFWVEVARGPKTEGKHYTAQPGDVLLEETFVLDPSCHVTGIVLDPDGYALADTRIHIEASYGDGLKDHPAARTNELGVFELRDGVRANKVVTLHLYLDSGNESWTSEPIECPPGQTIDLGEIQVASEVPVD
jgi:hypothetical protein